MNEYMGKINKNTRIFVWHKKASSRSIQMQQFIVNKRQLHMHIGSKCKWRRCAHSNYIRFQTLLSKCKWLLWLKVWQKKFSLHWDNMLLFVQCYVVGYLQNVNNLTDKTIAKSIKCDFSTTIFVILFPSFHIVHVFFFAAAATAAVNIAVNQLECYDNWKGSS